MRFFVLIVVKLVNFNRGRGVREKSPTVKCLNKLVTWSGAFSVFRVSDLNRFSEGRRTMCCLESLSSVGNLLNLNLVENAEIHVAYQRMSLNIKLSNVLHSEK